MHALQSAVDLLLSTLFAFIVALAGGLVRLFHEQAHGEPFSWPRVFLVVVAAILRGVVGQAIGEHLHTHYGLPSLTGGALGGLLGYLGPTFLDAVAAIALKGASRHVIKQDNPNEPPKNDK